MAKLHVKESLPLPVQHRKFSFSVSTVFIQAVNTGTQYYDPLSMKLNTVKLYVQNVVQKLSHLKLQVHDEQSQCRPEQPSVVVNAAVNEKGDIGCVIVLPPDKSVSLLFENNDDMWLIDSHSHLTSDIYPCYKHCPSGYIPR